MESGSFSFKVEERTPGRLGSKRLKSHPDKLLVDHLRNVGKICRKTVAESARSLDGAEILEDVAYITGATHDLGKATGFFQEYLNETDEKKRYVLKSRETTKHSLLSSLFTYVIVREYLRSGKGDPGALPLITFIAVRRHHGDLTNALDEISTIYADRESILSVVKEQVSRIDREEFGEMLEDLLGDVIEIDADSLVDCILRAPEEVRHDNKKLVRNLGKKNDILLYFVAQLLYSALLDADKTDAGLEGVDLHRVDLPCDLVDRYREGRRASSRKTRIETSRTFSGFFCLHVEEQVPGKQGLKLSRAIISAPSRT